MCVEGSYSATPETVWNEFVKDNDYRKIMTGGIYDTAAKIALLKRALTLDPNPKVLYEGGPPGTHTFLGISLKLDLREFVKRSFPKTHYPSDYYSMWYRRAEVTADDALNILLNPSNPPWEVIYRAILLSSNSIAKKVELIKGTLAKDPNPKIMFKFSEYMGTSDYIDLREFVKTHFPDSVSASLKNTGPVDVKSPL